MPEQELLSLRAYAQRIGVKPSTVSRAVSKGSLPVVTTKDGRKLIDPVAASAARRNNPNRQLGHGGKPDRAIRQQVIWRARRETGFTPEQAAILSVMRSRWPALMRNLMRRLGSAELAQARAVAALSELVEYMAVALHHDFNAAGIQEYGDALEPPTHLDWSPEIEEQMDTALDVLDDDDYDPLLDAGHAARP